MTTTTDSVQTTNNASSVPRPPGLHWRWGSPPTAAQRRAHKRWCCTGELRIGSTHAKFTLDTAAEPLPDGERWWVAKSESGDNLPWPTIIGDDRWDFADGSWCDPHPAAEGWEHSEMLADQIGGFEGPGADDYVMEDGSWSTKTDGGHATGDTIAERVRAAFDALQAARSEVETDRQWAVVDASDGHIVDLCALLTDTERKDACSGGLFWLRGLPCGTTAAEAWAQCPCGDWLIWLAGRRGAPRAVLVRAASAAIRTDHTHNAALLDSIEAAAEGSSEAASLVAAAWDAAADAEVVAESAEVAAKNPEWGHVAAWTTAWTAAATAWLAEAVAADTSAKAAECAVVAVDNAHLARAVDAQAVADAVRTVITLDTLGVADDVG